MLSVPIRLVMQMSGLLGPLLATCPYCLLDDGGTGRHIYPSLGVFELVHEAGDRHAFGICLVNDLVERVPADGRAFVSHNE